MYLNLFHNGKKYIYETGNKLNIGHLKEITDSILSSTNKSKDNKDMMHIIYNNPSIFHKYLNPNDKTFLRDLIPKGQQRVQFSIKLKDGNSASELKEDIKYLKNHKSMDKKENPEKKIFGNFFYLLSSQKKFNNLINYKYNEMLLEIRQFIRRINEIYEEMYKTYMQSQANYNDEMNKNNRNDVSKKIEFITQYEIQMIKFIEKEKLFFQKLNSLMKDCLLEQNGKIIISNKNMKELYKNMFSDNAKDIKLNFDDKEYINNIIENPFKSGDEKIERRNKNFKTVISNNDKGPNKTKSKNNLNLDLDEDILLQDKISKNKSRKFLHSLSFNQLNFKSKLFNPNNFNSNNTNNNFGLSNKNLSNKKSEEKKPKLMISTEVGQDGVQRGKIVLFSEGKNKKINEQLNSMNSMDKIKEEDELDNDNGNNNKLNSIKNRLSFRNDKSNNLINKYQTKDDINNNLNLFKNISSSDNNEQNNRFSLFKIKNQKTGFKLNFNLDNNENNALNKKNSGTNMLEVKNENNNNNNEYKNTDSTEYLHNKKNDKNNSNIDLNNKIGTNIDVKKDDDKNNINNNNNEPNNKDNKDNINNDNTKENQGDNKNNQEIKEDNINNTLALKDILLSKEESSINVKKKPKKIKKRKKRKSSSEEGSSKSEEKDNNSNNNNNSEKSKPNKKSFNDDDSKDTERSKKDENKDLFDLHLLRNLSMDKDNPYKRNVYSNSHNSKKIKENELIRPEIPESDESEEEKKKLSLFKKKKKAHIKNKYDFLI